jgi:hypothetical protein
MGFGPIIVTLQPQWVLFCDKKPDLSDERHAGRAYLSTAQSAAPTIPASLRSDAGKRRARAWI